MKEIVNRILDVIMYLIPFFGKRKRDRVVREVRYHTTCKEVCKVKTTEREKEHQRLSLCPVFISIDQNHLGKQTAFH